MKYDDMSDKELSGEVLRAIHGDAVDYWCLSDCGKYIYDCGPIGEDFYKIDLIDINNFDDWCKLAEKYGMSLDVSGRASIPKSISKLDHAISHTCEGKLGRAVAICVLKLKDAENDR